MERLPAYNPNYDNNYNSINGTYNPTPYISNFQNSYNYPNPTASTASQYYVPLQSMNMEQNYYPPISVNNTCQHCCNKASNESDQIKVVEKKEEPTSNTKKTKLKKNIMSVSQFQKRRN